MLDNQSQSFFGLAIALFNQESVSAKDGKNHTIQQVICLVCNAKEKARITEGSCRLDMIESPMACVVQMAMWYRYYHKFRELGQMEPRKATNRRQEGEDERQERQRYHEG